MTPELEALLPDEWPILEAEDFCKDAYGEPGGGRHCMVGWAAEVFNAYEGDGDVDYVSLTPWMEAFSDFLWLGPDVKASYILKYNDAPGRSHDELARTWNRFGAHLGFTEGNPEA